jgi:hypothetical protein
MYTSRAAERMEGPHKRCAQRLLEVPADESRHEEVRMDSVIGRHLLPAKTGHELRKLFHVWQRLLLGQPSGLAWSSAEGR